MKNTYSDYDSDSSLLYVDIWEEYKVSNSCNLL